MGWRTMDVNEQRVRFVVAACFAPGNPQFCRGFCWQPPESWHWQMDQAPHLCPYQRIHDRY